jgi:hypothetical protein
MADSPAFEAVCSTLETAGSLDRLAARGTVRLAVKKAGFEAKSVATRDLVAIVERVLPGELAARGVASPEALCSQVARALAGVADGAASGDTPEAVFSRLGGA